MYLFGASGHGKVVKEIIEANGGEVEAFVDDNKNVYKCAVKPVLHDAASSSAAFVGLDIVDGSYNGHFISHRFHQTGERYSLTGLLIEKILNLFKFRFR